MYGEHIQTSALPMNIHIIPINPSLPLPDVVSLGVLRLNYAYRLERIGFFSCDIVVMTTPRIISFELIQANQLDLRPPWAFD